jgi:sodium/bile acid cotransporter 7
MSMLARLRPDNFILALIATVIAASILPARGSFAQAFTIATDCAIALLFFLHGARLSRQAVLAGITHWRLHLTVFLTTFLLFPVLGILLARLPSVILPSSVAIGVIYLCCLPSTVQSSIAFTSIARGNVPAAICSASASNLFGMIMTPLLVGVLLSAHGNTLSWHTVEAILLQLFLPFIAGHLLQPVIGAWALRHKKLLGYVDRGSILMVVYGAFSAAVAAGLWRSTPPESFAAMFVVDALLLAVVLTATTWGSRRLGFNREDEITIVFCGSKKSLASGAPIAAILFSPHMVGIVVLPLMIFHQIQLMVCAALAKRYAER